MPQIAIEPLESLCAAVLAGAGMRREDAATVARHLVDAECKGVVSHGVQRVAYYLGLADDGFIDWTGSVTVTRKAPVVIHVDGGRGLGICAMERAVDAVLEAGRSSPLVAAGIVNVSHTGRLGAYAERLAAAGKLGLVTGGGGGERWAMVAPYGGRQPYLSTNPWAIALPAGKHGPVSVDFATSATANGKIRLRRNTGEDLPEGWIIDREGRPSTKIADYDAGGAILPAAGPKGYGLATISELIGTALLPDAHEFNWLLLALDLDAFGTRQGYDALAERVVEQARATATAPGFDRVRVAGDPEREREACCRAMGVPLHEAIWRGLVEAAAQTGVAVPEDLP